MIPDDLAAALAAQPAATEAFDALSYAVTDVFVTDGAATARAVTFTTVREGRIVRQTEYWPDPFEAPVWRAAWDEREHTTPEPQPRPDERHDA